MLSGNFVEITTSTPFRGLLHAANLRHGTDGFEPANLGTKGSFNAVTKTGSKYISLFSHCGFNGVNSFQGVSSGKHYGGL